MSFCDERKHLITSSVEAALTQPLRVAPLLQVISEPAKGSLATASSELVGICHVELAFNHTRDGRRNCFLPAFARMREDSCEPRWKAKYSFRRHDWQPDWQDRMGIRERLVFPE